MVGSEELTTCFRDTDGQDDNGTQGEWRTLPCDTVPSHIHQPGKQVSALVTSVGDTGKAPVLWTGHLMCFGPR